MFHSPLCGIRRNSRPMSAISGDEAPEGHVGVSGNDTAAASATFRQIVEQTFTRLSVDFGVIVVQGEHSQKRLHAIQDGLVPRELHKQDATPSPDLVSSVQVVCRQL